MILPKPTHDYVAFAPCGCVVGLMAVIPGHEKHLAKEIADFIADGCQVKLMDRSSQEFETALRNFGHHCQPKQLDIFSQPCEEGQK